jgi:hypothetical protein
MFLTILAACERISDPQPKPQKLDFISWVEENHPTFFNSDASQLDKMNTCQIIGAPGGVPCNGGTCSLHIGAGGNGACVRCNNCYGNDDVCQNGQAACTGGLVVFEDLLLEFFEEYPGSRIRYNLFDKNSSITQSEGFMYNKRIDSFFLFEVPQLPVDTLLVFSITN